MHGACMATKTISIDMEAYEKLTRARLSPKDSFSSVIKRAHWDQKVKTCGDLLAALSSMPVVSEEVLQRLEQAQREDAPPDDPRR